MHNGGRDHLGDDAVRSGLALAFVGRGVLGLGSRDNLDGGSNSFEKREHCEGCLKV